MNIKLEKIRKELASLVKGRVLVSKPLSEYTSFRIGGPADFLVIPKDIADLRNLVTYIKENSLPKFILGAGSNLLVRDEGFRGIAIKLDSDAFSKIEFEDTSIRVGAGVLVGKILSFCAEHSLGGLEFLSGIPGSIGGIIKMNAGVKEKGVSDITEEVTLMDWDGNSRVLKRDKVEFGYRSFVPSDVIILEACFRVLRRDEKDILHDMDKYISSKNRTQDLKFPSAGCIFKNPSNGNLTSGELIEKSGLKGIRWGDAKISEVHGNFIVNTGKAKAKDVISLMNLIEKKVELDYNIKLKPEIVILE